MSAPTLRRLSSTDLDEIAQFDWATVKIGPTTVAQICPVCAALVAPGSGELWPCKDQHIEYHRANDATTAPGMDDQPLGGITS